MRALERLAGPGTLVARLTFDFVRPVPIAPLAVRAEVVRRGAKVTRLRAALAAGDGSVVLEATGVALRLAPVLPESVVDAGVPPPPPAGASAFEFPFFRDVVGYHRAVEVRIARGTWGKGAVAAWMRTLVPLVEGEAPSPLQRLLVCADSASGLAVVLRAGHHTWINTDLTVAVHREPAGEWVCLEAATDAQAHGVGLTRARLWDERGPIGTSLQTLLIDTRSG